MPLREPYKRIQESSAGELIDGISQGDLELSEATVSEERRGGEKYPSPWTLSVRGPARSAVGRIHEERSERARDADERQNAPITTDANKWVEHPDRYDYPGVDTIPESRQAARAEDAAGWALEHGALDRAEHKGRGTRLQGKFSPKESKTYGRGENVARVQSKAGRPEFTLAHEVGHAIDYNMSPGYDKWGLSERLFGNKLSSDEFMDLSPDERREVAKEKGKVRREAREISKKVRGDYSHRSKYREDDLELTADAFAMAIMQPRATRRDAPNLFSRLEQYAEEGGWGDIIPDPLGRDPDRKGIIKKDYDT